MSSSDQNGIPIPPPMPAGIPRRVFLRAMGLSALGLAGGLLAPWHEQSPLSGVASAQAPDPIGDLAAALGYDIEAIFRFVADEIGYEPYAGILRGSRGTLAGHAGNSVDQALLLAGLLDASLVTYRFAIGVLDDVSADEIMSSGSASVDEVRERALQALVGTLPGGTAPAAPVLTPDQRAAIDRALATSGDVVEWARSRLDQSVRTIESALATNGVEVPAGFSSMPELERREHVWIQVDSGNRWLDLDPTLRSGSIGDAWIEADATLDTLPEELAHNVEIAVIGETISEGGLIETPLMRFSERADVLDGQPIMFTNVRPEGLRAIGLAAAEGLTGRKSYLPALVVGDAAYVGGLPITFAGAGQASGADDDLFGGQGVEAEATAEWLELTLSSPGADPVVVRRAVFDRIGIESRSRGSFDTAALAPVAWVKLGDHPDEVLDAQTTHWLTVSGSMPERTAPVFRPTADDPAALAMMAGAHHLLRELSALELTIPDGIRPFPNGPNVTSFTYATVPETRTADIAVDIWHRAIGVAPVADVSAASNPAIVAGCLSHLAERLLLGEADGTGQGAGVSVGRLFEEAGRAGIGVRLVRGPGGERDLPYPEGAKLRLMQRLGDGWLAIVPERPVDLDGVERAGWWLIHPVSGRTVDEMDDGRGEFVDVLAQTVLAINARPALVALTACFLQSAFTGMFLVEAGLAGSNADKDQAAALAIGLLAAVLAGVSGATVGAICF